MIELEVSKCPVCETEGGERVFLKEGESYARCLECGLLYRDPPPSPQEIRRYYEKGYHEKFGSRSLAIQASRLSLYKSFFTEFNRYRETGRLLDIGCGWGGFLKMAQEKGWEVWGIEPSWEASEYARSFLGSRLLTQGVEETDFAENYFDVITLWNVIDCLLDPLAVLRKIRKWLRPGGLLLVRALNSPFHVLLYRFYFSFRFFLEKAGWRKDVSSFQRANFNGKSLKRLLRESGFSCLKLRNSPLTSGDPYQVFSHLNLIRVAKFLFYALARGVAFLSVNRLLIGSNLIAEATKSPPEPAFPQKALRFRIFLKSLVLHGLASVGYLLGLPFWGKLRGKEREIRILRYHSVDRLQRGDVTVLESDFKKQLDFLTAHYSVIPLEEAVEALEKGKLPSPPTAVITFDDGYQDNYEVVFPILKEKNLPVTIFLLTGEEPRDRIVPHFQDSQRASIRLLQWPQIREMTASGISFASHGNHHTPLTFLPAEKLPLELSYSKQKIESELSLPVQFFSYPYGTRLDFNPRSKFFVKQAGYRAACSAIFGTNGTGTDRFALRRIGIEASDTLFTFRAKLNGALSLLSLFDLPLLRRAIRWWDGFFSKSLPWAEASKPPLLLVSVDFPPHTDGVSTISRELARRISLWGPEVSVIGPQDRGDEAFDQAQPYRVFRVPGYDWGYLRLLPILLALPGVILGRRVRKIFAMNIAYGGLLAWALSFLWPLEYLLFAYGYEFEKVRKIPLLRLLYLQIYHRAKGVVACSELVKQRLISFGVEPRKIKVLYPAVDLGRFRPLEVPPEYLREKKLEGRRILLTVGRLIRRKGYDLVLRILSEIVRHFPEVLYCIVGIGSDEKRLKREVARLGLEGSVCFMGKVPDEELVFLYNACEIFVMPSREIRAGGHLEGFGIVYLEANACGKPVIGGRAGGVGEAIREGETGLLVDPNSAEELAQKIIFLLSHPEEGQELGRRGLDWVGQTFNWDRYTLEAYQLLTGEA